MWWGSMGTLMGLIGLLILREVLKLRMEAYDPARRVPSRRLLRVSDFESETVDQFLHRAFNSPFPFEGKEWADMQPPPEEPGPAYGGSREPPTVGSLRERVQRGERNVERLSAAGKLEPPYVRVECEKCGEQKDAWVDDDGRLEDERDAWHSHPSEPRGGGVYPTLIIEEE